MQQTQYKINILVIYSRQHHAHYQSLERCISAVRRQLLPDGASALICHSLVVEDFATWQHTASGFLKTAHIVLLLVNEAFFGTDISLLQKIIAANTQPDVLLAAAPPPNLRWENTGFYRWLKQYFDIHLLTQLLKPHHNSANAEEELAKLVNLAFNMQQSKIYHLYLQEGNQLFIQKQWMEAGKKFHNALELGYYADTNAERFLIYEKMEICKHELQFDHLVKQGKRAYHQHNYPKAYHFFEHALQLKPAPQILLLREDCLRTPSPPHKLMKQFSEETWFYECLHEGDRLFMLHKWDAAHELYEEAAAIHSFDFGYNLSNIYRRMKACRTERCFEEAITLAREAYKAKNHNQALSFFEEACSIKPNDPTARRLYHKCRRIVTLKNMLPWAKYLAGAVLLILFLLLLRFFGLLFR
ncbi:MAG TPA: hypothetical protein PK239_07455 [Chitinophagales bacterium]|nr:hypothetical protein [Chitinophagales bacterium]HRK27111.1 hypothetical protein [Chitinophagales bacterium]